MELPAPPPATIPSGMLSIVRSARSGSSGKSCQAQHLQSKRSSPRSPGSRPLHMLNAVENTFSAALLFPSRHSIRAYALYKRRLEGNALMTFFAVFRALEAKVSQKHLHVHA